MTDTSTMAIMIAVALTFMLHTAMVGSAGLGLIYLYCTYQLCPHCQRPVRRARRGWLRCEACGREYHRTVRRLPR